MQAKLDALTREVFDLQETINWKDKKIGVGSPGVDTVRRCWVATSCVLMLSLHDGDPA